MAWRLAGAALLLAGCTQARQEIRSSPPGAPSPSSVISANPANLWRDLGTGWSRLKPPPFARTGAASVWAGRKLLYWGGEGVSSVEGEGAAYDPVRDEWRLLPASPLAERSSPGAVWTGTEMIIWGGGGRQHWGDGASFDPALGRWHVLAPAPLSPRVPLAAVWTGSKMIVWGERSRYATSFDGAAYDPRTDRWRLIARAPIEVNLATAVWTGREMIVFGALLDGSNASETEHAVGAAYDPRRDSWRRIPSYPLSPQASSAAWNGQDVVAWDYGLKAGSYDPAAERWRALPDLPLRPMECYNETVSLNGDVFAWYCRQAAILPATERKWEAVAISPEELFGRPVAAGPVVLFAGPSGEDHSAALWAFKPAG